MGNRTAPCERLLMLAPLGCCTKSESHRKFGKSSPPTAVTFKTVRGFSPRKEALSARIVRETVPEVGLARVSTVGNVALTGQKACVEHANADHHHRRANINRISIANLDISPKPRPLAGNSDGLTESSLMCAKHRFLLIPGTLIPGLE